MLQEKQCNHRQRGDKMRPSKYKCVVCNRFVTRQKRQWKSNYLRYQIARICPECLLKKLNTLHDARFDYNRFYAKMYSGYRGW